MGKEKIPLYVLNNFLKFERKLYQFAGLSFGRPIRIKTIIYFLVIGLIVTIWYFIPLLNIFIRWIPIGVLLVIIGSLSWLLSDIGTEGRPPMKFFRSFILYHMRKIKKQTFYRGKLIPKGRNFDVNGYIQVTPSSESFDIPVGLGIELPMLEKTVKPSNNQNVEGSHKTKHQRKKRIKEKKPKKKQQVQFQKSVSTNKQIKKSEEVNENYVSSRVDFKTTSTNLKEKVSEIDLKSTKVTQKLLNAPENTSYSIKKVDTTKKEVAKIRKNPLIVLTTKDVMPKKSPIMNDTSKEQSTKIATVKNTNSKPSIFEQTRQIVRFRRRTRKRR